MLSNSNRQGHPHYRAWSGAWRTICLRNSDVGYNPVIEPKQGAILSAIGAIPHTLYHAGSS